MSDEAKPDDREPTPKRQAELRAAYEANVAAGRAPYKGVAIRTRGELNWVVRERHWYADEDADAANLSAADLNEANLSGFHLDVASLSGATLRGADLSHARFYSADLRGATLRAANLSGTNLRNATLSGADLREARMDANTRLTDAIFDSHTRLVDVLWNGAPVTRLNWQDIAMLGDEAEARDPRGKRPDLFVTSRVIRAMRTAPRPPRGPLSDDLTTGLKANEQLATLLAYQDAVMANRQVATLLRSQGLNEYADRFTYRAEVLQREVFWQQRRWGGWLFSALLWLLSGFGYRLWRILAAYGAVLLVFAVVYWPMGVHSFPHEPGWQALWDSFLVSLSAIHGRTTFEQLGAWSPAAWTAAVESVVGIVIEGVFVAMLIQRFFAR